MYRAEGENALEGKFNKNNDMDKQDWIKRFVPRALPTSEESLTISDFVGLIWGAVTEYGVGFYYDIRQMQNVASDDVYFPAVFMEEYYGLRFVKGFDLQAEFTIELHLLDLCEMENDSYERDTIRFNQLPAATRFVKELGRVMNYDIKDFTCDPEPPMFDANAVGSLLRVTFRMAACSAFFNPYPEV